MSKVKFIRSGVLNKTPDPSQLELGQICINFHKDNPFLGIKLSEFFSDKRFDEAEANEWRKKPEL